MVTDSNKFALLTDKEEENVHKKVELVQNAGVKIDQHMGDSNIERKDREEGNQCMNNTTKVWIVKTWGDRVEEAEEGEINKSEFGVVKESCSGVYPNQEKELRGQEIETSVKDEDDGDAPGQDETSMKVGVYSNIGRPRGRGGGTGTGWQYQEDGRSEVT
ncbi:hypothetical protein HAX54_014888 [Datura stramonium]|uniref:Uncharacterized protein n=1 Tax=Datura stramonium TaxID=4076 RepID=A0ABS8Y7N3_DATST|nr:hypothetical protein [Datura stramonium]